MKPYTPEEHAHRYAAWCAATAARRGLTGGNAILIDAVGASAMRAMLDSPEDRWPTTDAAYSKVHALWCGQIVRHVDVATAVRGSCSFGRAAKVVAIYVKTRVVTARGTATRLAHVAYPPVDRMLLRALAKEEHLPVEHRKLWRRTSWTTMTERQHAAIIESLRPVVGAEPFWTIERYWNAREGDE